MALPYSRLLTVLMLLCFVHVKAQTVYYPVQSSELLRSTANDVATLLSRATGNTITTQSYSLIPSQGIVLIYDSSITGNQSCRIVGNGINTIKFYAPQDNGLCFGVYQYLNELGFRFYLPGDIWEKIPALVSVFRSRDAVVSGRYKYNSWHISGGHNRWLMDNDNSYGWDMYYGRNGHEWSRYQRRNNMNGAYRFNGHRGDIMNAEYLDSLRRNPCLVASFNGSRDASTQSVPDINNINSKNLWVNSISEKFTSTKNTILGNPFLYVNYYRNFNYNNQHIGIEVPDGPRWGNSVSSDQCATGNYNGNAYPKPSDQQFLLTSYTSSRLGLQHPGKSLQCYAYSSHADVPSSSISIPANLDVQVVATAFQHESSAKSLLNRWYARTPNISEYHYFNIPQWTGEAPMCDVEQYKVTLKRLSERSSQGLMIEASPAKFATLPYLYAGNRMLSNDIAFENSIGEFANEMFPANVSMHIKKLLEYFGDEKMFANGNFIADNKYKIPLFLQTLDKAVIESVTVNSFVVDARLREIKAYLHYLILYYDLVSDPRSYLDKVQKAYDLCLYLARISNLKLVNSYFLISDLLRKFPATHEIQSRFNVFTGTAYLNGALSLIGSSEIDANFAGDVSKHASTVTDYHVLKPEEIIPKLNSSGLRGLSKINLGITFTNSHDYANRTEFYFSAPSAGSFDISFKVESVMAGSFMNISAEADGDVLTVIHDTTIFANGGSSFITIRVPKSGIYKLSFVSKFKAVTELSILTRGNVFFRKGPFWGNRTENYRDDWTSLPRYFYVPSSTRKIFFSANNACASGTCASGASVGNTFKIKDSKEVDVTTQATSDPLLFTLEADAETAGKFWEVNRMNEYNLCFANISNIEVYAEKKIVIAAAPVAGDGSIDVFPNPSKGEFNFRSTSFHTIDQINIYNAQGGKVYAVSKASALNLHKFPAGVYIYKLLSNNIWHSGKLIKL